MTAALTISIPSPSSVTFPTEGSIDRHYYSSSRATSSSKTIMMIKRRDQDQIRAQFLNSLGIVRPRPRIATTPATINDKDHNDEDEISLSYSSASDDTSCGGGGGDDDDDDDDDTSKKGVSFPENDNDLVAIKEIPSFRDYDDETKLRLWNGMKAVAEIVRRNKLEFRSENWDWQQVLEEEDFIRLSPPTTTDDADANDFDLLIHPATYAQQQQEREMAEQRRRRRKKQKQYGYKSISACLDFNGSRPPLPRSPSPRSRSRKQRKPTN